MRRVARALLSTAAGLALVAGAAACGDDDDDTSVADTSVADTTTTSPVAVPETTAPDGQAGGQTGEQPLVGCERLDEQPDGVYQVAEAGEIEITFDGTTVALVEARPAEGWTATGDEEDDTDEVEVTFSQGAREIDFEAEIDDGRLEVDICVDD